MKDFFYTVLLFCFFLLGSSWGVEEGLDILPLAKEEALPPAPPSPRRHANSKMGEMIQHGKYLVEAVALCAECHTPRDENGLIMDKWLQGASLPWVSKLSVNNWASYAGPLVGLPEGWKEADMVQYLETGMLPGGGYSKLPMPPYRMSHRDALAIALYLESLKDENPKRDSSTIKNEDNAPFPDNH